MHYSSSTSVLMSHSMDYGHGVGGGEGEGGNQGNTGSMMYERELTETTPTNPLV